MAGDQPVTSVLAELLNITPPPMRRAPGGISNLVGVAACPVKLGRQEGILLLEKPKGSRFHWENSSSFFSPLLAAEVCRPFFLCELILPAVIPKEGHHISVESKAPPRVRLDGTVKDL